MTALTSCGNSQLDECVKIDIKPFAPLSMSVISKSNSTVLEMWLDQWKQVHEEYIKLSEISISVEGAKVQVNSNKYCRDNAPDWESVYARTGWLKSQPLSV